MRPGSDPGLLFYCEELSARAPLFLRTKPCNARHNIIVRGRKVLENRRLKMKFDAFKITADGLCPRRKVTYEAAERLAEIAIKKGRHGKIEAVWFDDHSIYFETIREF